MNSLENNISCGCGPESSVYAAARGPGSSFDDATREKAVGTLALVPITEVRRRTGLTRKTLLVYEALGLVLPAARTEGGYRLYDHQALRRLELVTRARGLGLTLAEAEDFVQAAERGCGEGQRALRMLLERKLAETALRLEELDIRREGLRREAGDVAGHAAGRNLQLAGAAE